MRAKPWVLVVGLVCTSMPAPGLAAPGRDGADEIEELGIEPIASRKLGEEADRTRTQLEGIKARVERGPSLGVVERELPKISERIAELDGDMPSRGLDALSERELEDLTFTWGQAARQARELQGLLGDESDRFAGELQRVDSMGERWAVIAESMDLMPAATEQAKTIRRTAKTPPLRSAATSTPSTTRRHRCRVPPRSPRSAWRISRPRGSPSA